MTDSKTYDIRQVSHSDPANLTLASYAFTSSPKVRNKEEDERYLQQRSDDKIFFSYLNDEPVARVGIIPMTQNVRGKVMPMGGISGVCSMPAARRGGHIRALMQHSIQEMQNDGQAVSTLYPFKTSYYEMFGFAGWQIPLWTKIEPSALAPYLKLPKHGEVKQQLSSDAKDAFYTFLQDAQASVHGMASHPRVRFDNGVEKHPSWFMSVQEGDTVTAGICYTLDLDKEVMNAPAVFWSTMNGMLQVFDFMARHVDQVKHISMPIREGQYPHLWVTDDWRVKISSDADGSWGPPMGRVVSVAELEGISVGDAEATITINDPQAPWNNGTWTLRGKSGALEITEGGDSGGEVSIAGFSAMVFNGLDPLTLPFRSWGLVDADTAAALQVLFPVVEPYLHELF